MCKKCRKAEKKKDFDIWKAHKAFHDKVKGLSYLLDKELEKIEQEYNVVFYSCEEKYSTNRKQKGFSEVDLLNELPASIMELIQKKKWDSREIKLMLNSLEKEGKVTKSMRKTSFGFEQVYYANKELEAIL